MPQIDLSILNQRQTPAFYADVLANRPSAGFVGRIFISTNTFAFFRDNGTGWDLIGGPGTGTVTGSGANGQVSFWNGASSITGSNDLFWDSVNGHLGIGTNVPGTALDVHHDQSTVAIVNQTVATNDVRIGFQNNGVGLWRIGAFYNAGANDFGIFDAVASIQPVTVKKTTGQVLIGTSTVGSGKLVVASATNDNHIQIVGATAPSLRIDSAESGPTKRIGIGLATAVNNFIQNSQNLDMCIFNGSTSAAGNMLFGIYDTGLANIQEAARISAARNFLIGTITDSGEKLQVSGTSLITGAATFSSSVTANGNVSITKDNPKLILNDNAGGSQNNYSISSNFGIFNLNDETAGGASVMSYGGGLFNFTGAATFSSSVTSGTSGVSNGSYIIKRASDGLSVADFSINTTSSLASLSTGYTFLTFATEGTERMRISGGNVGIGTTLPTANLQISGYTSGVPLTSGSSQRGGFRIANSSNIGLDFGTVAAGQAWLQVSDVNNYASNFALLLNPNGGNLLIGTTTDAGYKLAVNGDVNATSFVSTRGIVSVAPVTFTTFFTPTTSGLYIARVYLAGNATSVWDAAIMFIYDVTDILVMSQINGTNVSTQVSGANVQVRQIGGTTYDFNFDIIKIR